MLPLITDIQSPSQYFSLIRAHTTANRQQSFDSGNAETPSETLDPLGTYQTTQWYAVSACDYVMRLDPRR